MIAELRTHAAWLDEPVRLGHWRTHDGDEVDSVMEFDDGRVLAFEVKADERVTGRDLKGLRTRRGALADRFIAGVAFTTGSRFDTPRGSDTRHAGGPAVATRPMTVIADTTPAPAAP